MSQADSFPVGLTTAKIVVCCDRKRVFFPFVLLSAEEVMRI
jgi:hypothetical protein